MADEIKVDTTTPATPETPVVEPEVVAPDATVEPTPEVPAPIN